MNSSGNYLVLVLVVFLCFSTYVVGGMGQNFNKDDSDNSSPIEIPAKIIDVGAVPQGVMLQIQSVISNNSNLDIAVQRLDTSCDCAKSTIDNNTIKSGGDVALDTRWNVGAGSQQVERQIRVLGAVGK